MDCPKCGHPCSIDRIPYEGWIVKSYYCANCFWDEEDKMNPEYTCQKCKSARVDLIDEIKLQYQCQDCKFIWLESPFEDHNSGSWGFGRLKRNLELLVIPFIS